MKAPSTPAGLTPKEPDTEKCKAVAERPSKPKRLDVEKLNDSAEDGSMPRKPNTDQRPVPKRASRPSEDPRGKGSRGRTQTKPRRGNGSPLEEKEGFLRISGEVQNTKKEVLRENTYRDSRSAGAPWGTRGPATADTEDTRSSKRRRKSFFNMMRRLTQDSPQGMMTIGRTSKETRRRNHSPSTR